MALLDLSHPINAKTLAYPGDPNPAFFAVSDYKYKGCLVTAAMLSLHTATHVDAPAHIYPDARSIEDYDLDDFQGRAAVIDCRSKISSRGEIPDSVLQDVYDEDYDWVLFHTGWDRHWATNDYFDKRWPVPSMDLLEALADCEFKGIGIDTPGLDRLNEDSRHKAWFEKSESLVVENLCNLGRLLQMNRSAVTFMALPIPIQAPDAALVRAAAVVG